MYIARDGIMLNLEGGYDLEAAAACSLFCGIQAACSEVEESIGVLLIQKADPGKQL